MHLSCCVSEPYNGLIETYFVHIAACPILKSPAQDHFKKIWVSRENIKVTLIKGQNHESRREKKLGMLVPLGEACSRSGTADQGFRQGGENSLQTLTFPLPTRGPRRRQGLCLSVYKAMHTSSGELYKCLFDFSDNPFEEL